MAAESGAGSVQWDVIGDDSPAGPNHNAGRTVTTWGPSLCEASYVTTLEGNGELEEMYNPGQGVINVPFAICQQHCAVSCNTGQSWFDEVEINTEERQRTRTADTKLRLRTGGKARPRRMNLWVLTGGAEKVVNHWEPSPCNPVYPKEAIPPTSITIGSLGKLGSDGRLYVVLPDGANPDVDVTPVVQGLDYYTFNVVGRKYISRLEVFVRQPFPEYPYDERRYPDGPPLGYPIYDLWGPEQAGHAWWRLTTEAPANIVERFAGTALARSLGLECGYGPEGASLISWIPPVKQGVGKVYHDNGIADFTAPTELAFRVQDASTVSCTPSS